MDDREYLKLQMNAGMVWYLEGAGLPEFSGQAPADFLDGPLIGRHRRVRVLGMAANAILILPLFVLRYRGELQSVQVAAPRFGGRRLDCADHVLSNMRFCDDAPCRGGWHELTHREAASYALTDTNLTDLPRVHQLLRNHPVWPRLQILPDIDPRAVARLLGLLRDPRFYVDPQHPDRLGRLKSYLGLEPFCWQSMLQGVRNTYADRCRLVQECLGAPRTFHMQNPAYFLQRERLRHQDPQQGTLRAAQLFVHYLYLNWLDALYPQPLWLEPLFVPRHFFRVAVEAEWCSQALEGLLQD